MFSKKLNISKLHCELQRVTSETDAMAIIKRHGLKVAYTSDIDHDCYTGMERKILQLVDQKGNRACKLTITDHPFENLEFGAC